MITDFVLERMAAHAGDLALATHDACFTYGDLLSRVGEWQDRLAGLPRCSVVSLEGDYGADSISAFLALTSGGHIIVPLSPDSLAHHESFREIGGVEFRIDLNSGNRVQRSDRTGSGIDHPLYSALRTNGDPGLVLFSSGSTGKPKAAVHNLTRLLAKFEVPRRRHRTLVFLLLDHIGGINTLFYTLANAGAIVLPQDRSPASVCEAISRHRVELLPTSPTFLNLLLLSGAARSSDLSSLQLITYGTEPMPASTLEQACREFPHARFQQTYGLTELGILRSQSRDSSSLWVRVGGEDFESKVVDGQLWIRARSAMVGYLNAPSPFDADGFFNTGDHVETDGEWVRFLGRDSDLINVGGSKVYPAAVESVLLQMDNVADAMVCGEPHALTGQIVSATIRLRQPEASDAFKVRMRRFCAGRLSPHQIPMKLRFTDDALHSSRFKRIRRTDAVVVGSRA